MHHRSHFHMDCFDTRRGRRRGARLLGKSIPPVAQTELDVARHALRTVLRADKRLSDDEQRRIANILNRATLQIAGLASD